MVKPLHILREQAGMQYLLMTVQQLGENQQVIEPVTGE